MTTVLFHYIIDQIRTFIPLIPDISRSFLSICKSKNQHSLCYRSHYSRYKDFAHQPLTSLSLEVKQRKTHGLSRYRETGKNNEELVSPEDVPVAREKKTISLTSQARSTNIK